MFITLDVCEQSNAIETALKRGYLFQVYQPKVCARTHTIVGVESLMRWNDPVYGSVPPSQFIPIAESTGTINKLTLKAIHDTISQCSVWNKGGMMINVSINVSIHDLQNSDILEHYVNALQQFNVDPSQITFEVTETAVMLNRSQCAGVLGTLKAMGSNISIDDFGTGHASFIYLKHFPISEIKIDKVFVDDVLTSSFDRKIVKFTIDLAHELGCKVVAEGVENQATAEALLGMGCDVLQGYYFGKPMSGTDVFHTFHRQEALI